MVKKVIKALSVKLMCLGAATVIFTACGGGEQQQQHQGGAAPVEVETYIVKKGSTDLSESFPSTIKGKTDIEIHLQVSGTLTKVNVDEGPAVRKGQVLFLIDQVLLEAA